DAIELAQEHADDPKIVPALQETKAALEQSLPQQIAFDDIGLQFGERWIPTEYYEEYVGKLFDTKMEIHYAEHIDEYSIKAENRYNLKIREEYCVRGEYKDYDGMALLQHAFHDTTPDIQKCVGADDNGNDIKAPDMEKIQLASSKIQEIREGFTDYLTNLPKDKRDELQEMYNRKFNCFVKAKYDGSHQTFPGIDMKALGSSRFNVKDIYKSQKDCVWMLLQNGGGICDHEVGTGKTLIMCMAAHEMHRLGLANKPMIIALKANVAEIANTYQAAFPDDKILYASEKDFSPANRVDFFNRIKNNDYACVVMSHDQFGKIPQSMDIQQQILSDELRDIDEALDILRQQGGNISGRMLTGLEKRKENLQVKIMELQSDMASRKDDFVDFGNMGIDHIFIDESHQFKNLMFTTRHQRVSGLGNPAGSQKALNLLYALRTIQKRTGKDLGATFLSGTTISNSLTELYLLFKYLRPKAMEQQGIHSFDAWAAVYAKKTSDYEFSVTNAVVQKERFRYFVKVPELATFYNEITDYRTGEDVGLDRPAMNVILHNIKPTADQQDFNERLVQFAQTGDGELIF
ncbi:MAG: DNA methylase, partial [Prevotella sp.]|nr:DNA methylase [Prevotella sp.]